MPPTYVYRNLVKSLSNSPDDFVKRVCKFKPDKSTRFNLLSHYINEANHRLELMENLEMPKKQQRNQNQYGTLFCAITLDTAQKKEVKKWLESVSDTFAELLADFIRCEWKTSISFDEYNDCFIAASTQREEGHINENVCVTSRSQNMFEAIMLNYWKVNILYAGKALPTEREKSNFG